jgi:hypothetical protein
MKNSKNNTQASYLAINFDGLKPPASMLAVTNKMQPIVLPLAIDLKGVNRLEGYPINQAALALGYRVGALAGSRRCRKALSRVISMRAKDAASRPEQRYLKLYE